jgi:hypothetical protein
LAKWLTRPLSAATPADAPLPSIAKAFWSDRLYFIGLLALPSKMRLA